MSQHPSHAKPRSPTRHHRGFDLVVHAEVRRASAGGSAASVTSTWIAWHRRNEVTTFCERLCPSMTKGKNERTKRIGSRTPTNAMQLFAGPKSGPAAPGSPGAPLSAFHRGSRQGARSRPRLSLRPRFLGRGRLCWRVFRRCTSRRSRSATRLMPKAAREGVANPHAGTALARTPWPAGQSASESWARIEIICNQYGDDLVNGNETNNFRAE